MIRVYQLSFLTSLAVALMILSIFSRGTAVADHDSHARILSNSELASIFGAECNCYADVGWCTGCTQTGCDTCYTCSGTTCGSPGDSSWKCSGIEFLSCKTLQGNPSGKYCKELGSQLCKERFDCNCEPLVDQKKCDGQGSCEDSMFTSHRCKDCSNGDKISPDYQENYRCEDCQVE